MDQLKQKLTILISLGYSKEQIIKIAKTEPDIFIEQPDEITTTLNKIYTKKKKHEKES